MVLQCPAGCCESLGNQSNHACFVFRCQLTLANCTQSLLNTDLDTQSKTHREYTKLESQEPLHECIPPSSSKWVGFQCWCEERRLDPLTCAVRSIFSFQQCLLKKGLTHTTIKVYALAVSSCHESFGERPILSQCLVKYFLHSVSRQHPVIHASISLWELPLVPETMAKEL